jgi:integrase
MLSNDAKCEKPVIQEVAFYHCDGAGAGMYLANPETIILRRSDFLRLHDYALNNAPLRDLCLIRVPMKCGVRPGEIQRLRWDQVDFQKLTLNIIDSKKHKTCPVPMDMATADYLKRLLEQGRNRFGWVIERDPQGRIWVDSPEPLTYENLEFIVKKWAKAAGCETWKKISLYALRHFFAASWAYPQDGKAPGNLHALSKILRHKSLLYTQIYLSRLVFYEDIQSEYDRVQSWPFAQDGNRDQVPACGNEFFDRWCRTCEHMPTCKYIDRAMSSPWASGCRFHITKKIEKEEIKYNR